MELLQSVITNSYPSITTLLKFFFNQVIDIIINCLTTYPLNLLIFVTGVFVVVYCCLSAAFGEKLFKAKYNPLPHKQNLFNEMKLLKKEIREIQTDIIDMKKKSFRPKEDAAFEPV